MKDLKSTDVFIVNNKTIYVVKRPDAKAKIRADEVPRCGEVVLMDGKKIVVLKAYRSGDSEFNYWPEILVSTNDAP